MVHFRLNLPAIEASLRDVQRDFDRINERLDEYRDPMTDEVVANMMAGYDGVDRASRRAPIFSRSAIPGGVTGAQRLGALPRRQIRRVLLAAAFRGQRAAFLR